jgi:hypothetical protein
MKKYLLVTSVVTAIFANSLAFASEAGSSLTCSEIYAKTAVAKTERNAKAAQTLEYVKGGTGAATFVSLITGIAAIPIALFGLTAAFAEAEYIYSNSIPNEQKIIFMSEGQTKQFYRLFYKAKKIRSDVTEQEIISIVEQGLESGKFCENFPKLYSPRMVRNYVLEQVAAGK